MLLVHVRLVKRLIILYFYSYFYLVYEHVFLCCMAAFGEPLDCDLVHIWQSFRGVTMLCSVLRLFSSACTVTFLFALRNNK